ncbi:MAG TPA: adenylate/guanylate cyclase domain-containing protein [Candidatus Bathyarchaeia archaeon]|nr:adenylate/guanylate cyclase domain-containing protein [Candidatus Bathyarchaeia archaeon]
MNERILVVDDTPANIQTVASILKGQGYQLSVATNGKQALDVIEKIRPDLILLDVMMPELDGFETCQRIKSTPAWQDIPIIFLTAKTDTADLVKGFEMGAVDYVGKPFNAHELLARVNTHLTVDQLRRSLAAKNVELARAHELVRHAFGRYVSEEVAESLLRTPEALKLGGEERETTILMSDLRGFTAMAGRMPPGEVIEILNLYLETMVEVIGRYEGTIDEIIGDAILVIFGAPVASDDHAARAVACGLGMQLAMAEVNERLATQKRVQLEMGIGIHTGRVIVGNIGSLRRTKYAAVGSNVNLAGRVESFTTGGQVLITEDTRAKIEAPLRIDGEFQVEPKGAAHSLRLFEIGSIGAPYSLSLPSRAMPLRALADPLAVQFTVLEEKFSGRTVYDGRLTELSAFETCLESSLPQAVLSNLKITVAPGLPGNPAGEIYGKVVSAGSPGVAIVRFTSISPELKAWAQTWASA